MTQFITPECSVPPGEAGGQPRRGFLTRLLGLLAGAFVLLTPLTTGILSFFNPWRQKGGGGQFIRLATLDTLPADGTPLKAAVIMDQVDAWNRAPNQPVGAVFLRRTGATEVEAFNVVCPHAGCSVDYKEIEEEADGKRQKVKKFFCECHRASFDLSGKRTDAVSPSPRDLDSLAAKIENRNEVWVQFQNFEVGKTKKVPTA